MSSDCLHLDKCERATQYIYRFSFCNKGLYGDSCSSTCPECPDGNCDPVGGSCMCPTGYTGPTCSQQCPAGKWGPNCMYDCRPCSHGLGCHHATGDCLCRAGWTGYACMQQCREGVCFCRYIRTRTDRQTD